MASQDERKAVFLFNELFPNEKPNWKDLGKTWKERVSRLQEEKENRRRLQIDEYERREEDSAFLFFYLHGDTINKMFNTKKKYDSLPMNDLKKEYDKLKSKIDFLNEIFHDDTFFMQHEKTYFMERRIKECCDLNGQEFWEAIEEAVGRPFPSLS
jgi:hypothetical protein